MSGEPVPAVMRDLNEHYGTLQSRSVACSNIRKVLLREKFRPAEFDDAPLRALAHTHPDIPAFLAAPLEEQVRVQRSRATAWPEEALRALRQLALLPHGFGLSMPETMALQAIQKQRQIAKNGRMIHITDAGALLALATELLERGTSSYPVPRLVLPLLLVSGRRMCELLNGQSTFDVVDAHHVVFQGQLKRRDSANGYTVPLLCPSALFMRGMALLRARQGDVRHLDNGDVTARYEGQLRAALPSLLGLTIKVHELRALYLAFVYLCFDCDATLPCVSMRVLGHLSLAESNSYNHIRLDGADAMRGSLGALRR